MNIGLNLLYFVVLPALIGGIAVAFPILWQFLGQYQRNRILILFDPTIDPQGINERYHSKINLQSLTGGGLTGQGLFNGNRTQGGFLFAQHTDYIFAAIGEELGFVGAMVILLLFALLIIRGFWIAMHAKDRFGALLVAGIMTQVALQVFFNIGVVTNFLPATGISLPFFSYGGTALLVQMFEMGVVLSVSRQSDNQMLV